MGQAPEREVFGVLGGMGPLASAEFLRTIYEYHLGEREQTSPVVIVYSDPTFPDRTDALLAGDGVELTERLIGALTRLSDMGASQILICCVTIHHLLPRLPDELREKVISLLDVVFAGLSHTRERHLLLCTRGTMSLGLFQNHERWESVQDYVVLPDESDQQVIHDLIYRVKRNHDVQDLAPALESLLARYEVNSFVAGCTEMHLLAKHFISSGGRERDYSCVDPLNIVAKELGGRRR